VFTLGFSPGAPARTGRSPAAPSATLAGKAGARQFLDIGTGIPTAGNTHEVAQAIAPESRVVYVDYDPCKSGCAHVPEATQGETLTAPLQPADTIQL
jgi:S-adenosyl methyltransferase